MNELIDKAMLIIQPLGLVVMLVYIYGFLAVLIAWRTMSTPSWAAFSALPP